MVRNIKFTICPIPFGRNLIGFCGAVKLSDQIGNQISKDLFSWLFLLAACRTIRAEAKIWLFEVRFWLV